MTYSTTNEDATLRFDVHGNDLAELRARADQRARKLAGADCHIELQLDVSPRVETGDGQVLSWIAAVQAKVFDNWSSEVPSGG